MGSATDVSKGFIPPEPDTLVEIDERLIRAVALVAAALEPRPGTDPLFDRAESYADYIRDGVVGGPEGI